ncbi:hypothetical protein E3N88_24090 [Mikania micrantha]|uniref:Uncharacterized protein n=1 Tax=Mikania micrantha TaxID=192012 RepID=A0A5N6NG79_9ASTR|nr:hypothetical protein E3N88_24090 [Mikania micrantha]
MSNDLRSWFVTFPNGMIPLVGNWGSIISPDILIGIDPEVNKVVRDIMSSSAYIVNKLLKYMDKLTIFRDTLQEIMEKTDVETRDIHSNISTLSDLFDETEEDGGVIARKYMLNQLRINEDIHGDVKLLLDGTIEKMKKNREGVGMIKDF